MIWSYRYMVDVACVVGGEGVCLPSVSDWGV